MSASPVVTRFAPSPTGYLHIGGARTALFAWAYARHHGKDGQFILRIEDTDRVRSTEEAAQRIQRDLQWLGIQWDQGPDPDAGDPYNRQIGEHGPYCQSQRLDLYNQHIDKLIEAGLAYRCYRSGDELAEERAAARAAGRAYRYDRSISTNLTSDQISQYDEEGRKHVVRFRVPDHDVTVQDHVLGPVTTAASEMEDFVIRKSDGYPTYHLAVVVDDALMQVTHVLRGQEHLNNTVKHWALQDALGFAHPVYAHIPLIFNADGSKMSKRDKSKAARAAAVKWMEDHDIDTLADLTNITDRTLLAAWLDKENDDVAVAELVGGAIGVTLPEIDVHDFRASGYLPEVLCNYLSLLGWSPGENVEKFDMKFLVERFDLSRIGKTNARFDRDKLFRFNADAVAAMPVDEFVRRWRQYCSEFEPEYIEKLPEADFAKIAAAYHERSRTLAEPCENGRFFVLPDEEIAYDDKAVTKILRKNEGQGFDVLRQLRPKLEAIADWSPGEIEKVVKGHAEEVELGLGKVAQPLRVAVSGSTISPPIFDTLAIVGRDSTLNRIDRCLQLAEA
ncbi:MAG: glutamate--tRNA ligase [Phycisphaeraceae bacterium]